MARRPAKPSLPPVVFDTDVLIWYFRGHPAAQALIQSTQQNRRWISSLSLMELLQGFRNKEESLNIQSFVAENISRILHPRTSISEKAIHMISEYALSHGLRVVDALIASTALLHRATLATGNKRHFAFIPGLTIHVFAP